MLKLLHWELKNTLLSKRYLIMLAIWNITNILMLASSLHGNALGYGIYKVTLFNLPSLLPIIAALFAGMSVSGGYQDRLAQLTVTAGYRRIKYTLSKSISYLIGIAVFCISAILVNIAIIKIVKGLTLPTGITQDLILPTVMVTIIMLGTTAIFLAVAFFIKSVGPAIGASICAMLGFQVLSSVLRSTYPSILKWLPWEQVNIIIEKPITSNYILALIISIIAVVIFVSIAGIKFNRVELK